MAYRRLRSNNEGWLTSYADLITNLLIFFVLIISASQIQTGKMERIIAQISENRPVQNLSKAADEVSAELERQDLTKDVTASLTDDGLEISFDSGVIFDSGSAEIKPLVEEPLRQVLQVLLPYASKYHMAIEGHTDERPVRGGLYKTNWELSSARAMSIRERLERAGVDSKRIRVEAYADNKTLPPEQLEGADRETNLAKHRRVVIRLY